MSEHSFEREVRDTVVKSTLTGVAATVAAVTIFSPAGLGGMVGTSMASGAGVSPNLAPADSPYTDLPPFRAPLSAEDLSEIHSQLAATAASMALTRAATDARIEHIRSIAVADGAVTFAPLPMEHSPQVAQAVTEQSNAALRLTLSDVPASGSAPASAPASVPAPAPVESVQLEAAEVRVSYSGTGGGVDYVAPHRDPHLELAELFMAFSQD